MTTRIVTVAEGGRLTRSVTIGPHHLLADEPEPLSDDAGPTPGELLLAALGSCTSMAVRAMADRHGWPLERVDVAVRFGEQGHIVKNVGLTGDLDPAQREQLLAAAGRCPIHRLLTRETKIVTVPALLAEPNASPI
ncbi:MULTISPECIES: OsmC family protein [Streptomyces]|uniref:OsmC family protein n=1 Tax=Streptomyces TaxID=1883 RepID=UPI001E47FCD6|nr:OsmC family protein [Streptomyces lincolnensis]MCD7445697.1 OsmC family protein [Streptomyces lincolnensis]